MEIKLIKKAFLSKININKSGIGILIISIKLYISDEKSPKARGSLIIISGFIFLLF